jgi:hypothetical protein
MVLSSSFDEQHRTPPSASAADVKNNEDKQTTISHQQYHADAAAVAYSTLTPMQEQKPACCSCSYSYGRYLFYISDQ